MNLSLSTTEEAEIIINPEDLPNFRLAKDSDAVEDAALKEQTPMEVAKNFLVELERGLKKKKPDDLLYLYDRKFNKICETVFKSTTWPTAQEIEQAEEDLEFDIDTQYLYAELCYRHIYARINTFGADVRLRSFENYLNLFDAILNSKDDIALPVPWIWDILDEFLYQYQAFCQYRAKMKEGDEHLEVLLDDLDNVWTLDRVTDVFKKFIEKSKVIKNGKLEDLAPQNKTLQYFGYFSIVCLCRLYVLVTEYDNALKAIESIEFKKLNIFAKAFPCLITLFYYAGFAYLMSKRYRESVKLFEVILSCFIKYKQFYSKSFQYESMSKQAEKSLLLLGIALVFYPTQIDENVAANLKEKFSDKLEKINKYDIHTFNESFSYGCPKLLIPIRDVEHFKNFGFDINPMESVHKEKEALGQEFSKIQQLNNLSGVLKLYDTIKLEKLATVLGVSTNDLKSLINLYQQRNNAPLKDAPFEQTVVKRLLESVQSLDFVIEGGEVKVSKKSSKTNFSKIFYKNIHKLEEITHDIQTL